MIAGTTDGMEIHRAYNLSSIPHSICTKACALLDYPGMIAGTTDGMEIHRAYNLTASSKIDA